MEAIEALGSTIALLIVIAVVCGLTWIVTDSDRVERGAIITFWVTISLLVLALLAGIWIPVIL